MKNLNIFDTSQNQKGPISQGEITGGQKPDGTPQAQTSTATEAVACPPSVSNQLAAKQGKPDPNDNRTPTTIVWGQMLNSPDYAPIKRKYMNGEITLSMAWLETKDKWEEVNSEEYRKEYKPVRANDWPNDETYSESWEEKAKKDKEAIAEAIANAPKEEENEEDDDLQL